MVYSLLQMEHGPPPDPDAEDDTTSDESSSESETSSDSEPDLSDKERKKVSITFLQVLNIINLVICTTLLDVAGCRESKD